jgi:CheY-like chemotaxis protein
MSSQWREALPAVAEQPTRVLVVDDDEAVRTVLCEILNEEGFEVVGRAVDGIEGVSLALSLSPDGFCSTFACPGWAGSTLRERSSPGSRGFAS